MLCVNNMIRYVAKKLPKLAFPSFRKILC